MQVADVTRVQTGRGAQDHLAVAPTRQPSHSSHRNRSGQRPMRRVRHPKVQAAVRQVSVRARVPRPEVAS